MSAMGGLTLTPATNFPINFKLPLLHPLSSNLQPFRLSNRTPFESSISLSLRSNDEHKPLDIAALRSASVRLIDGNQNMVGVVSKTQARQMAQDAELDLVIVSPDADPPVVRMMDYNKYKYELQKKKKGQQKRSAANQMDLKELKMGYNIDKHDYSVRLKAARKFLKYGDKVKVIVNLKGRENEFRNIAIELIKRFQSDVGELSPEAFRSIKYFNFVSKPQLDDVQLATEETKSFRDRNIFIVMVPNKAALQKAQEPPKKKDKSAVDEVSAGVQS
ncbi:Translation initiation factor IF-3 [Spatholobus suberectus]|nr:Translation initiation factor IF-3 [Spatholobus suberectus]